MDKLRIADVDRIELLIEEYKDMHMPDADVPFHHEAEIAAGMRHFVEFLRGKVNVKAKPTALLEETAGVRPVVGRAYRYRYFCRGRDHDVVATVAATVSSIDPPTAGELIGFTMSNDVASFLENDGTSLELSELTEDQRRQYLAHREHTGNGYMQYSDLCQ